MRSSMNSAGKPRKARMTTAVCAIPPIRKRVIRNKDVTPDELFEVARLVVAAEIAKIHTIEWTPQLLYDEPLYKGMNANWNGLLGTGGDPDVSKALSDIVVHNFGKVERRRESHPVVFRLRLRPGYLRAGQQGSALRHHQARSTSTAA